MEIKNITLFFVGMILLMAGSLIVIFDYPQIQFFKNVDEESYHILDVENESIYQRLIVEFAIGMTVLAVGIGMIAVSFLNRFQNRVR